MYNPSKYKSVDLDSAFALMDYNPFATVVTTQNISHLPLTPIIEEKKIILIGHMARANPHWKDFATMNVTAIFHGPHAYVSPVWYEKKGDVPTWNYSVVHATGRAQLIEGESELIECLKILSAHSERHWPSSYEFSIPQDLSGERLTKSIVGFRIEVDAINFKQKLSQNKTAATQEGVMRGLRERGDHESLMVLRDMEEFYGRRSL